MASAGAGIRVLSDGCAYLPIAGGKRPPVFNVPVRAPARSQTRRCEARVGHETPQGSEAGGNAAPTPLPS
jgi:hypothetical protein